MAGAVEDARLLPLGHHLSLMPSTEALSGDGEFWTALAACSEYFGGAGTQSAQVWDGGETVLGPLHLAEGEPPPADGSPISRALRRLGVVKGDHFDEFDAVGLGRHRHTGDWLPA